MSINDIQNKIVEEFSSFSDWFDVYEHLTMVGKTLEPLDEGHKTEEYLLSGCQSNVWLMGEMSDNNTIVYHADSDALITKGIIALLLRVYNNQPPQVIVNTTPFFIDSIGLSSNLSPTRSNGVASIIKNIKDFANHCLEG